MTSTNADRLDRNPAEALADLLARLGPVGIEQVDWPEAAGRVLAEPVLSDRDSPPCDVSAMDGYAVRFADLLAAAPLPLAGEVAAGEPPPALPPGAAMRIFTGGAVPTDADSIVPREQTDESPEQVALRPGVSVQPGQHIRRAGENLAAGQVVVPAGTPIDAAVVSAAAAFGAAALGVRRRVRVALLVTGDELLGVESAPAAWQLRDSNGPALWALLGARAWLDVGAPVRVPDEPGATAAALAGALAGSDAVVLTGGVSMGDRDYVPEAVSACGAETVFHRLPIRPGKPVLGGVGPAGQAILALPGNPVAVLVTAVRFALPALARRAGLERPEPAPPLVRLVNPDGRELGLWWYRLVRLVGADEAELVASRGSGDLVSAARADGFVELPPYSTGAGPWPFFAWGAAE